MSHLTITNLRKSYGAVEILKDVNLDIKSGEFVVFVGPSGCGKSTLLRCISGLENISAGELRVDGKIINDLAPSKRGIAMVFQSYALYPHMSVYDNMAYSLKLQHASKEEIRTKVNDAARKLQIETYLDRFPKHLSGGQRQRVAIGRAIVRDPKIFLFDEPLSNLDAALRVATRLEIAKLKDSLPETTMIYVTHDQVEAMTLADRIVVLNGGRVEQVGTPAELYENPQSIFVAGFIGSPKMNLVTGTLAQNENAHTLGIRPEHVTLQPNGKWQGRVMHVEYLGADTFVYVDMNLAEPFVIRMSGKLDDMTGREISFSPELPHLHRFSEAGEPII